MIILEIKITFEFCFLLIKIFPLLESYSGSKYVAIMQRTWGFAKLNYSNAMKSIFAVKIISKMKTFHCFQINENTALLSNKIYMIAAWSELLIDNFWLL